MDQIRIADLPTTTDIQQTDYVIVERPDVGEGTYKSQVQDFGSAIIPQELIDRLVVLEENVQSIQNSLQSIGNTLVTVESRLQEVETAVGSMDIRLQAVEQVANIALTTED